MQRQKDGPRGAVDEPGTAGWELLLPPVEPVNETIIGKATDDGFVDTGSGELLDRRGVRRVVICGLLSEMCVSATARVLRVAEHALGDEPMIVDSADVDFTPAPR